MYQINKEIVVRMLEELPADKKKTLHSALTRNSMLTSFYGLSCGTLTVYKEGFHLELSGTRCAFNAYAQDDDGELKFTRKPNSDKLHMLYQDPIYDTLAFINWYKY